MPGAPIRSGSRRAVPLVRTLPFTLRVSANGRYVADASTGAPVRLHGDTAWELCTELTQAEVAQYLDDRASRGINALIIQATNPTKYSSGASCPAAIGAGGALPFQNASGGTWDGDPSFRDNILNGVAQGSATGNFDADFSRPVAAYWDWVDTVLDMCRARRIVPVIDPMYMGYNFGSNDGWWRTLQQSRHTQAVCYAFGQWLGARWARHGHVIIKMGTDMFPTSASEDSARFRKIFEGMQAAGCSQLVTAHYKRSSDALDYADYADLITFNATYGAAGAGTSSFTPSYARTRRGYARTPVRPAVQIEDRYEIETPDTRGQRRAQMWWSLLSSGAGHFIGNGTVWLFTSGWQAQLGSTQTVDFQQAGAILNGLRWYDLIPRNLGGIGELVTAGGGTEQAPSSTPGTNDGTDGQDWIAAACTADGKQLVAYRPVGHSGTFTIDRTKLSGSGTARWVDPVSGASTSAGAVTNTGTQVFTVPGANSGGDSDWLLVLEVP